MVVGAGVGGDAASASSASFMHLLENTSNPLLSASAPVAMDIPQANKLSPVPEMSSLPREVLKVNLHFKICWLSLTFHITLGPINDDFKCSPWIICCFQGDLDNTHVHE